MCSVKTTKKAKKFMWIKIENLIIFITEILYFCVYSIFSRRKKCLQILYKFNIFLKEKDLNI